ncbi:MAG: 16S rRNA (guanine(966)-N(2))-methyltransferase RsmD [Lachnospiraceae bacterium]|nr:16S rRNA (guanine(966)-N(2))-methyltransferase RsmD [Lachnospiraceae bacterium]
MRVIAGSARRLQLKAPEGLDTRPTQDIIKETLFNCIQTDVPGASFLDLFAGSGAIGIEALSRGASSAVFVENNKKAVAVINENLEHTHLAENARVCTGDALVYLHQLDGQTKFDIIYVDPPYKLGIEKEVIKYIFSSQLLNEDGMVILEALKETDLDFINELPIDIIKEKDYKNNRHLFMKKKENT